MSDQANNQAKNQVILFGAEGAQLPAYMRDMASLAEMFGASQEDVSTYASYPSISIKGKVWATVEGDERRKMMNPRAPDEVAQFIEVNIIRANDKHRAYFKEAYKEGASDESQKPACFSMDGVTPSVNAQDKQSDKCATCPHAVWGSRVSNDGQGTGKGTACAQSPRLAVAAPDALDKPYLLRVPPASIKPLREVIDAVQKRKLPYPVVTMKLGFDPDTASPKLTFRAIGLQDDIGARKIMEMREADIVRQIVGADERAMKPAAAPVQPAPAPAPVPADPAADLDNVLAARAAAPAPADPPPAPAPAPAPKAPPAPAPAPVQAAPAPAPKAEPTVQTVEAGGDMLSELNNLLGALDDPQA